MNNYYLRDPLQFGGFIPDPYAAPNKSAGGTNPYTLALLQAVGGLMTPGPYYGAFGGQVGQAATAGAQGMGQVQRLELLRKQQESEEAYRRRVLDLKGRELTAAEQEMERQRQARLNAPTGERVPQQPQQDAPLAQGYASVPQNVNLGPMQQTPPQPVYQQPGVPGEPPPVAGPRPQGPMISPANMGAPISGQELSGGPPRFMPQPMRPQMQQGPAAAPQPEFRRPPSLLQKQDVVDQDYYNQQLMNQDNRPPTDVMGRPDMMLNRQRQVPIGSVTGSIIEDTKLSQRGGMPVAQRLKQEIGLHQQQAEYFASFGMDDDADNARLMAAQKIGQLENLTEKRNAQVIDVRVGTDKDGNATFQQMEAIQQSDGTYKYQPITGAIAGKKGVTSSSKINIGFSPTDAGKTQLAASGITDMKNYRTLLYGKDGKVDRSLVAQMNVPFFKGVPWTDSRRAVSYLFNAVEGKLRIESGAAVPEPEVVRIMDRFFPSIWDDNKTIADKERRLTAFLEGTFERIKGENVIKDEYGNVYNFNTEDRFDNKGNPVKTEFPEEFTPSGSKNKSSKTFSGQSELDKINKELEEIDRQLKGTGK